jgi:DNA-binding HxlR family transcriptional regulator
LTASRANGSGSRARAGTRALALLASPLNATILRELAGGPMRLVDLRRECGSPAQTTLRAHLKELEGIGAIAKQRRNSFPGALEYELAAPGTELLFVSGALEGWLQRAPDEPWPFPSAGASAAIKALVEAWSSTMLRALAAGPLSLTELDGVIGTLNYPSLERRLSAMRLTRQVEACPGKGNGTPYRVTEWLRRGIAPLAAAVRWERRHRTDEAAPITRVDTEAFFLLTLPLLRLPSSLSGSCRMGVEIANGKKHGLVGAMAYLEAGKVASCTVRLVANADAWATGSVAAWLNAVVRSDLDRLELGGDQRLARGLLVGLHETLFEDKSSATARRRRP